MMRQSREDRERIIKILVGSFAENKSVRSICGDDTRKRRKLMEYAFNYCNAFGKVYLSEDRQACALVLFPEKKSTTLRTLIWDVSLATRVVGLSKLFNIIKKEAAINRHHPICPIYYLWFLGVDPAVQGSGRGSALMEQLLEDANAMARPVYLETSNPANLAFYKSMGINVYRELSVGYKIYLLNNCSIIE
ncbi:MAG: GNAT family N-acetyltransferase [Pedobacter sp.]|nr:MAG: GNAT family N-acetyltransferase [Pedobacter sp.]